MAISGGIVAMGAGMGTQAYFGSKSAKKSAKAQRAAAEIAMRELRRSKDAALGFQRPYYASGTGGLNALSGLLTGTQYDAQGAPTTLSQQQRSDLFQKSPGYQFRLEEAQNALTASQAAKGGLLSGGAMKEMNRYTQGIASDEYGSYINQLQGLAGMGQQSANAMGNIELGIGSQLASYGSQGELGAGQALADNYQNMGNLFGGTLSQAGGMAFGAGLANMYKPSSGVSGMNSNWNYNSGTPNFNTQLGKY